VSLASLGMLREGALPALPSMSQIAGATRALH